MSISDENSIKLGRIAAMLPVRDIEKSYNFYNQVFGFERVFENGNPVGFVILEKDNAELHLTLQPSHKAPPFNVAHMLVSDAETAYQRCQREGGRIIRRLENKEYGLKAFVFADLDGNRIDVGEIIKEK